MDDDNDTRPQVQEEQGGQEREEKLVFSAEDDIDEEELSRCWQELSSRERPIYVRIASRLKDKDSHGVYQRLCGLRFREYKASLLYIITSYNLTVVYTFDDFMYSA